MVYINRYGEAWLETIFLVLFLPLSILVIYRYYQLEIKEEVLIK